MGLGLTLENKVMSHSKEHAGLQKHSVGELYPWSIKRIGDRYVVPFHCITGEEGRKFTIDGDSRQAYRDAEQWVREYREWFFGKKYVKTCSCTYNCTCAVDENAIAEKRNDTLQELSDCQPDVYDDWDNAKVLWEYSFLVPHEENSSHFTGLENKLLDSFGGFTKSKCSGTWIDNSGEPIVDDSWRYNVAFDASVETLDKLVKIITWAKRVYNQECIYVVRSSISARLV